MRQELRDIVLFATHDMARDPPFSHVDLVTCRNVLIYLERELQEQVCATFHYALEAAGLPGCWAPRSADQPPGLFRSDRPHSEGCSNRLRAATSRACYRTCSRRCACASSSCRAALAQLYGSVERSEHAPARARIVAPPSILVDEHHHVWHMSDSAGRYLQPSGGPLSGDVVDLVRQELRFELRSALHRVFEQKMSTVSPPLLVRFNGDRHRVHLHVKAPQNTKSRAAPS